VTDAPGRDWVDIAATVLLALAAVATAWSSYQAARWNGEQANTASAVNKARIDAARASDLANAQAEIDVETFSQWVDAYARRETFLADFYFKRFRSEFKPAVNAWLATQAAPESRRSADPVSAGSSSQRPRPGSRPRL
jgi:hypothetical protein